MSNPVIVDTHVIENPVVAVLTGSDPVVQWLIPDFIAQGSLIVLAGEPGAGKSFVCYTLGLAGATNTPILGFQPTHPLRILYFDQENSRPDRDQYLRWAWNGLNQPSLPMIAANFWVRHFELGTADWVTRAASAITDIQPDIIFIDTATPCCAILDENDNGIATQVINRLRGLQAISNPPAAMIVLKHSRIITEGMDGDNKPRRTIRGAKAWAGAADAVWFHVRTAGHPRTDGLFNTYIEPAKTRAFGLRQTIRINPVWIDNQKGLQLNRYHNGS